MVFYYLETKIQQFIPMTESQTGMSSMAVSQNKCTIYDLQTNRKRKVLTVDEPCKEFVSVVENVQCR